MNNVKIISFLIFVALNTGNLQAQSEKSYYPHRMMAGIGYEVLNPARFIDKLIDSENFETSTFGVVSLQYTYELAPIFDLGVDAGYSQTLVEWNIPEYYVESLDEVIDANFNAEFNKFTLNLRGNVHFTKDSKVDPYTALGIGFKMSRWKFSSNAPGFNPTIFAPPMSLLLRFGVRFMFTEYVGAFVEGGIGHGALRGGITAQF